MSSVCVLCLDKTRRPRLPGHGYAWNILLIHSLVPGPGNKCLPPCAARRLLGRGRRPPGARVSGRGRWRDVRTSRSWELGDAPRISVKCRAGGRKGVDLRQKELSTDPPSGKQPSHPSVQPPQRCWVIENSVPPSVTVTPHRSILEANLQCVCLSCMRPKQLLMYSFIKRQ